MYQGQGASADIGGDLPVIYADKSTGQIKLYTPTDLQHYRNVKITLVS